MNCKTLLPLYLTFLVLLAPVAVQAEAANTDHRPNLLLIVADDLGYADLGIYGSDIRTPNLDALAREGLRFSQFHTGPYCAPTRAMLMSGNNNHVAGLRTERWKLVARSYYRTYDAPLDALPLLFDMRADPGETYSVARLHPEALADMRVRLERARAKYEPLADLFPKHVAPASAAEHPD